MLSRVHKSVEYLRLVLVHVTDYKQAAIFCRKQFFFIYSFTYTRNTLSNVDDGETVQTPVATVLSLQNLMDANNFCFVQCYINVRDEVKRASNGELT